MRLLADETETYREAWAIEAYAEHSPGEVHAERFVEMARLDGVTTRPSGRPMTMLDAGAGSGKGALALAALGFQVTLLDITDAGLVEAARALPFVEASIWGAIDRAVGRFDYVYCCDVMEHIDESLTMLAIARMLDAATRGVFLSIALVPDEFGVLVGRPLHLTVRPFTWWRDRLAELGRVVECRDLINAGLYYVEPFRVAR